jgi:hypothetical protein
MVGWSEVVRCLTLVLLCAVLGACASTRTLARPEPTGKEIHIYLKRPALGAYQIEGVRPDTPKRLCRTNEDDKCKPTVAWVLKGKPLPAGWKVEVRLKAVAIKKCFSSDKLALRTMNTEADSGTVVSAQCDKGDIWPYDVVLLDDKDKVRDTLDPLVIINY